MSEWSPQASPRRESDGIARLVGAVQTVAGQVRESTSNLLRTAGIFLTQQGMRITRSLLVEGDFASTGSAVISGSATIDGETSIGGATHIAGATDIDGTLNVDAEMSVGGDATFSGAMRVEGTLSLPAGIIDNDALANPITMRDVFASEDSFAFSGAAQDRAIFTYTVPDGFTRFTFTGAASVRAYNATGATIYLYAQAYAEVVGGDRYWGPSQQAAIPAGFTASVAAPHSSTIDVPPGATQVRVWARVQTSSPVGAAAQNFATVEGVAIFTR